MRHVDAVAFAVLLVFVVLQVLRLLHVPPALKLPLSSIS